MLVGMTDEPLTVAILREIRDEVRKTNDRLDAVNDRLSGRLDTTNERLDRVVQEQVRLATAFVQMEATQREMQVVQRDMAGIMGVLVREVRQLNQRLDHVLIGPLGTQVRDHETRIGRLEERAGKSE
jgi:hypothetical protein